MYVLLFDTNPSLFVAVTLGEIWGLQEGLGRVLAAAIVTAPTATAALIAIALNVIATVVTTDAIGIVTIGVARGGIGTGSVRSQGGIGIVTATDLIATGG